MTPTNGKTPTKLSGRASKRPNTNNPIGFIKTDNDLAGLYRPAVTKEILGKQVRVLVPAFDQAVLVREFLYLTIKDIAMSPEQLEKASKEEVHSACEAVLGEFALLVQKQDAKQASASDKKRIEEISQALLCSPQANPLLMQVIRESFPDLSNPERLTSNAKMECFNVLMDMIINNLLV